MQIAKVWNIEWKIKIVDEDNRIYFLKLHLNFYSSVRYPSLLSIKPAKAEASLLSLWVRGGVYHGVNTKTNKPLHPHAHLQWTSIMLTTIIDHVIICSSFWLVNPLWMMDLLQFSLHPMSLPSFLFYFHHDNDSQGQCLATYTQTNKKKKTHTPFFSSSSLYLFTLSLTCSSFQWNSAGLKEELWV